MAKYLVETDQGKFEVETEEPDQASPDFLAPGAEKSFAESAVDAISPEVTAPPEKEGFLSRLARGTRETFFPTSMDEVKRLFNPNLGQYGASKVLEEEGRRVGGAVRGAAMNTAEQLATSKFGQQNPNLAAGLGAGYSTVADVASDSLTPSAFQQQMGGEGMGIAGQAGLNAAGTRASALAQNSGRRALGFIKSQLKKTRGGVERANAVAQEALDKGVITPLSSADDMLPRAQAVSKAGKAEATNVIQALDRAGSKPDIDAVSLAEKVETQLRGALGKNPPQADLAAIKEIKARIAGYGKAEEPTLNFATLKENPPSPATYTFDDIQKLKEVLQEPSKAKWTTQTDAVKADLYRRASGIVNSELRRAVGEAGRNLPGGEGLLKKYLEGNLSAGKGAEAARALEDRSLREAGNNFIDPFTGAVGLAGAGISLYQQDPAAAAATIAAVGLRKFGRNYGAQITAKAAYTVAKKGGQLIATRPGFLSTLQASAKRALERDSKPPQAKAPPKSNFLDRLAKKAIEPDSTKSQAFEQIPSTPKLSKDMQALRVGIQALDRKDTRKAKESFIAALKINAKNLEARRALERIALKEGKDIDTYRKQARGKP